VAYAGAEFWDQFYWQRRESGRDLDWGGLWTGPFLLPLREAGARAMLELGCGTGNDAARLAGEGYSVTAIDVSGEAIGQARARYVAMHMFPDGITRTVFAEVRRLVRPGGLFLFHVNALEDRPLRARRLPARELESDYVAEESGQTMHFFSAAYLRELLGGWRELDLTSVPIPHRETGELYKHVWRGVARR
jgi:SAM-dependent methyltransferase